MKEFIAVVVACTVGTILLIAALMVPIAMVDKYECGIYAEQKQTTHDYRFMTCYVKAGDKWLTKTEYSNREVGLKVITD